MEERKGYLLFLFPEKKRFLKKINIPEEEYQKIEEYLNNGIEKFLTGVYSGLSPIQYAIEKIFDYYK